MNKNNSEYSISKTEEFDKWLQNQSDEFTVRILARLDRVAKGNFGDYKPVSKGIYELKFHFGQGIRIYYTIQNNTVVLLLHAGDKGSQKDDIKRAKKILGQLTRSLRCIKR